MGPSGSGKSTLGKLLQGFYQAEEGSIHLDGRDLRHLSANELRQYFGVVPQETVLFSGTILDNLVLANPHATFERVVQHLPPDTERSAATARTANRGQGAWCGAFGRTTAIAIARALLKRPAIDLR
jgi:subfamily B ATP-binding cassette protein HlyB/CyaB